MQGIWSRCRRLIRREDGIAMVAAVGFTVVLGITGTTMVAYTTQNSNAAAYAKEVRSARALAEAGLNNALSVLFTASSPSMPNAVPETTEQWAQGEVRWWGALDGKTWTLTGRGTVRSPTGRAPIVRTVTTRVGVGSSTKGSKNNAVWNYVYADELSGCTTLGNFSEVNIPLYVRGNLCLNNQSSVTGYALQVGGNLSVNQSAFVGTLENRITEVHIGGACALNAVTGPCGDSTRVYAHSLDNAPTGLTKPPVDLANWYLNSKPGPKRPCTTGSIPAPGFDNDGVWNDSNSTFQLTPPTAYDCRVLDASGNVIGRLTWTPGDPGRLEVAGTIFFDGDIVVNKVSAYYVGKATIYAAGTITMSQHMKLCGVAACDGTWKPTENLLAFVAGSSSDATGFTVENYSTYQGAVYVVGDYREGNNSTVWGPIIADQIYLQNSTLNFYVPIGTLLPGMPATYEEAVALATQPGSWGD